MYLRKFLSLFSACLIFMGIAVFAADHKEAPLVQESGPVDINDLYAFVSPSDPGNLVLIMTVNPFSVPGAATAFNFSPRILYRFQIDNDGDIRPDYFIDINFDDDQSYVATFSEFTSLPGEDGNRLIINGQATAPTSGVTPNDPVVAGTQGVLVFAGPTDDPFFFDSVGFSRTLAGTGTFTGADGFGGFNVSSIVVEIPIDRVIGDSTVLNIWATTENPIRIKRGSGIFGAQIDRVGNPAIATALIPGGMRDDFNRGRPANDGPDFAGVIVASLQALGTDDTNIGILASVAVPDVLTIDVDQPSGFPNGRGLADDVIDTILFFVFNQTPVADGVDANDAEFSDEFPYLAPPWQP